MAPIFLSYSRADRQFIDQFAPLIRRVYGNDSVWYDSDIHGGADWWQMILDEIGDCDLFIYLISNESLESPYCQSELREALRLEKQILPVIVRRLKPSYPGNIDPDLASILSKIQYVDMSGGFKDANTIATLYAAINHLLDAVPQQPVAPAQTTPTPEPPVPDKKESNKSSYIIMGIVLLLTVGLVVISLLSQGGDDTPTPSPTTQVAQAAGTTPATHTPTATETPSSTPTPTLTQTPTLSLTELEGTVQALVQQEQTHIAETNAIELTATEQARTAVAQETAVVQTQIAAAWTPTHTPNITETVWTRLTQTQVAKDSVATQEALNLTATATLWTNTPTNTRTPTSTPSPTDTPEADTQINITGRETVTFVEIPDGPNINLRAGPGTNFAIVDTVSSGQRFKILETDGDWFRIGNETWIFSGVVETFDREVERVSVTGFGSTLDNTVATNDDWTPFERDFDGVTMVLVPAGCFMMGSNDGESDEQPIHEICFEEPFWIDKYEVTNADYGSTGCETYSSEPDQPRNCVDWFDARDFCEARGGRLPTEAEWEYAARGPDALVYPWGNDFVANNVVYSSNSDNQTAPVGSRPGGASWVGALDLSGNVWEWTSSLYEDYPYRDDHESNSNTSSARVLRGGSFFDSSSDLRAADRGRFDPVLVNGSLGFRCVRS